MKKGFTLLLLILTASACYLGATERHRVLISTDIGGTALEDVAQTLHDEPAIADRIRVYWIGGPNKRCALKAPRG
ncbi:MAG: hypothetical protein NC339_05295 [Muribaculaceae bacterium]|nr:hypothetical protein [Muribaculaceae bacterium]